MPQRILFLTVGGSPDPLLTSYRDLQPDRVVFFTSELTRKCVDGSGKPNERRINGTVEKIDNFVALMRLDAYDPEEDLVIFEDIDEVQSCYRQVSDKVAAIKAAGHAEIAIDYTGGTKTMSAALLLVAVDEKLEIHVTTGLRDNTRAVNRGQATREVGITNLRTQRHLEQQVSRCLQNFDYSGAQNQLKGLLRPRDLSPELRKRIQWLGSICDALAHWDNFAHQAALECIDSPPFRASKFVLERLYKPLDRLVKLKTQLSDSGPLPPGTCGYELVEDLILNAQRRAQSGRYDDAVGRYYRALEMLAQRRLKIKHDIDTSKVEEKQIPPSLLAKLPPAEDGIRKFGLRQSYELLQALEDPTIAAPYAAQAKELLNALKVRNNSLFAHGYDPIGPREYQEFHSLVDGFMQPLLSELFAKSPRATQLPKKLDEIFSFPTSGVGR